MSKRKYTVSVHKHIYCSSSGDYSATVVIRSDKGRDKRNVGLSGCRIMWENKPFTYKGYPQYVTASIAEQLKTLLDNGELQVYEHDRDGNRRYEGFHIYHEDRHLEFYINLNYDRYGKEIES